MLQLQECWGQLAVQVWRVGADRQAHAETSSGRRRPSPHSRGYLGRDKSAGRRLQSQTGKRCMKSSGGMILRHSI